MTESYLYHSNVEKKAQKISFSQKEVIRESLEFMCDHLDSKKILEAVRHYVESNQISLKLSKSVKYHYWKDAICRTKNLKFLCIILATARRDGKCASDYFTSLGIDFEKLGRIRKKGEEGVAKSYESYGFRNGFYNLRYIFFLFVLCRLLNLELEDLTNIEKVKMSVLSSNYVESTGAMIDIPYVIAAFGGLMFLSCILCEAQMLWHYVFLVLLSLGGIKLLIRYLEYLLKPTDVSVIRQGIRIVGAVLCLIIVLNILVKLVGHVGNELAQAIKKVLNEEGPNWLFLYAIAYFMLTFALRQKIRERRRLMRWMRQQKQK